LESRNYKYRFIVWRETRFDIFNRLGVDNQCDRQTDRQTESPLAIARSNIVRRALKGAKVSVLNAVMLFLWTVLVLEGSSRIEFVGLDLELGWNTVA